MVRKDSGRWRGEASFLLFFAHLCSYNAAKLEFLKRNFKHKRIIQFVLISSQVTSHQVSRKRKERVFCYPQSHGSSTPKSLLRQRWGWGLEGRANVEKEREEDGEKEGGRVGEAFHAKLFPLFIFTQIL